MTSGDIRYVARSLLRARWFSVGALLTYSLGIGLNIAVFAVVDRVLFRPLPFSHADRLVTIHPVDRATKRIYAMFPRRLADEACRRAPAVEDLAFAGNARPYFLDGPEHPPLRLTEVSFNILSVLGVQPILGRAFLRDDAKSQLRLVLLREEVWRGRFVGDTAIIGRRFRDERGPIGIAGILPAGFITPSVNRSMASDGLILSTDVLAPSARQTIPAPVARLRSGASAGEAGRQIAQLVAGIETNLPEVERTSVLVEPIRDGIFWNLKAPSIVLFAGGLLVWLLACTNLGTLMVARASSREEQGRVRICLGATRAHVAGLVLAEVALLCVAGSVLAVLAAAWALQGLGAVVPVTAGNLTLTAVDGRVLGFVVLAGVLGSLIAAVCPLWGVRALSRPERRATMAGRRSGRGLLVAESAFGIVLVAAGVLALRSFVGLVRTDLGFSPDGLFALDVAAKVSPNGETRLESYREAINAMGTLPGISAVSAVDFAVGSGEAGNALRDQDGRQVLVRRVFSGYFAIMRTPLVAGRLFSDSEIRTGAPVAAVNVSAAQLFWPDAAPGDALGRPLSLEGDVGRQVIGVVSDTRERHGRMATPEVILPADSGLMPIPTFLVRTTDSTAPNIASLRAVLRRQFGADTVAVMSSVQRQLEPWLRDPRFYAVLFGGFGLTALLLSAVGLFALTSYEVSLSRKQIGIRLALGATPGGIERMYLIQALLPVACGIVVGTVIAVWMAQLFQPLLHEVNARDEKTYCLVAALFLLVTAVAAWRAARMAARTDPITVLRSE